MQQRIRKHAGQPCPPPASALHPAARTFGNLLLAGDWTLNGVNAGCAESAITSGMLASREVVGEPRDHLFTDYFLQAGREVHE